MEAWNDPKYGYDEYMARQIEQSDTQFISSFDFANNVQAISNTNIITSVMTGSEFRTSVGVGDGSTTSAGILINRDGFYACQNSQTLANANVKILATGAATFSGTVTATAGAIGGWNINSTSIYTGTEDHSGYTANAGDLTIYSDGSDASIHAKNFYIDTIGVLNCTSAVVQGAITAGAGSSLPTDYLSGVVGQSNLNLANRGWVQTCAFSITDADTIAWGAGTFTSADGTAYSIGASNTGDMAAKTYIYLDIAVSTTAYQTTTTATTAVGVGKVLVAIAQNGTGEATYKVLQGQGGENIDAANIVAGSITTNEIATSTITSGDIAAGTITATEINVGSFISMPSDTNLVAHWSFDEASGATTIKDITGNNNATLVGATIVSGVSGNALNLDGNDYATVPYHASLDVGDTVSISFWVNITSATGTQTVFTTTSGNTAGAIVVDIRSGKPSVIIPGLVIAQTTNAISADSWHHIVYTRNGAGATHKIYIDGVEEVLTTNLTNSFVNLSQDRRIGTRNLGSYLTGKIDDLRIYNIAISAKEVQGLYLNPTNTGVINANKINVGQLSGISADLGTITAGTITGATIQTASANQRVKITSAGIEMYNSAGTLKGYINNTADWTTGVQAKMDRLTLSGDGTSDNYGLVFSDGNVAEASIDSRFTISRPGDPPGTNLSITYDSDLTGTPDYSTIFTIDSTGKITTSNSLMTTDWTAYIPTITAPGGTPPTYTAIQTGKYCQIGKMCYMTFCLTNSSGGTAGSGAVQLYFSLPITAAQTESTDNVVPGGNAVVYNGAGTDFTLPFVASTTTGSIRNLDTSILTAAGQNNASRQIYVSLQYETA